jgi:hypothetical protein
MQMFKARSAALRASPRRKEEPIYRIRTARLKPCPDTRRG